MTLGQRLKAGLGRLLRGQGFLRGSMAGLNRLSKPLNEAPLSRIDKALHRIRRSGRGLEIGPSHNPIAPKSQGFDVDILDHASAEELRQKYKGHAVDIERIEAVDYIWQGQPLDELIGQQQCYDYIIASHVIEHTPDLVAFLQQCTRLLRADGILSLVIPDKRYCFDYFRWPSSTGEVLDAYLQQRRRHSPGVVFEHLANAVKSDGQIAWAQGIMGNLEYVHGFEQAVAAWHQAQQTSEYQDVHQWRFTPASFRLVLHDLNRMGLTELTEACRFDTQGCEFFISLSKGATAEPNRMHLAKDMMQEMRLT